MRAAILYHTIYTNHYPIISLFMAQQKINLTKNLKDIEQIVAWFEAQEEVDVEEGIEKVKAGAQLIKESKKRLAEIENEFEEVKKELGE